jgi:hypothetical protein
MPFCRFVRGDDTVLPTRQSQNSIDVMENDDYGVEHELGEDHIAVVALAPLVVTEVALVVFVSMMMMTQTLVVVHAVTTFLAVVARQPSTLRGEKNVDYSLYGWGKVSIGSPCGKCEGRMCRHGQVQSPSRHLRTSHQP